MKPINEEMNHNIYLLRSSIGTRLDNSLVNTIVDIPKAEIDNNTSLMVNESLIKELA